MATIKLAAMPFGAARTQFDVGETASLHLELEGQPEEQSQVTVNGPFEHAPLVIDLAAQPPGPIQQNVTFAGAAGQQHEVTLNGRGCQVARRGGSTRVILKPARVVEFNSRGWAVPIGPYNVGEQIRVKLAVDQPAPPHQDLVVPVRCEAFPGGSVDVTIVRSQNDGMSNPFAIGGNSGRTYQATLGPADNGIWTVGRHHKATAEIKEVPEVYFAEDHKGKAKWIDREGPYSNGDVVTLSIKLSEKAPQPDGCMFTIQGSALGAHQYPAHIPPGQRETTVRVQLADPGDNKQIEIRDLSACVPAAPPRAAIPARGQRRAPAPAPLRELSKRIDIADSPCITFGAGIREMHDNTVYNEGDTVKLAVALVEFDDHESATLVEAKRETIALVKSAAFGGKTYAAVIPKGRKGVYVTVALTRSCKRADGTVIGQWVRLKPVKGCKAPPRIDRMAPGNARAYDRTAFLIKVDGPNATEPANPGQSCPATEDLPPDEPCNHQLMTVIESHGGRANESRAARGKAGGLGEWDIVKQRPQDEPLQRLTPEELAAAEQQRSADLGRMAEGRKRAEALARLVGAAPPKYDAMVTQLAAAERLLAEAQRDHRSAQGQTHRARANVDLAQDGLERRQATAQRRTGARQQAERDLSDAEQEQQRQEGNYREVKGRTPRFRATRDQRQERSQARDARDVSRTTTSARQSDVQRSEQAEAQAGQSVRRQQGVVLDRTAQLRERRQQEGEAGQRVTEARVAAHGYEQELRDAQAAFIRRMRRDLGTLEQHLRAPGQSAELTPLIADGHAQTQALLPELDAPDFWERLPEISTRCYDLVDTLAEPADTTGLIQTPGLIQVIAGRTRDMHTPESEMGHHGTWIGVKADRRAYYCEEAFQESGAELRHPILRVRKEIGGAWVSLDELNPGDVRAKADANQILYEFRVYQYRQKWAEYLRGDGKYGGPLNPILRQLPIADIFSAIRNKWPAKQRYLLEMATCGEPMPAQQPRHLPGRRVSTVIEVYPSDEFAISLSVKPFPPVAWGYEGKVIDTGGGLKSISGKTADDINADVSELDPTRSSMSDQWDWQAGKGGNSMQETPSIATGGTPDSELPPKSVLDSGLTFLDTRNEQLKYSERQAAGGEKQRFGEPRGAKDYTFHRPGGDQLTTGFVQTSDASGEIVNPGVEGLTFISDGKVPLFAFDVIKPSLTRNGAMPREFTSFVTMAATIVNTVQNAGRIVEGLTDSVPSIGFSCTVSFGFLEGNLHYYWGWKEFEDHRVFKWDRFAFDITLFRIAVTLTFGPKVRVLLIKFEVVAYVALTGELGVEGDTQRQGPDSGMGPFEHWFSGATKIAAGLRMILVHENFCSADAAIKSGYELKFRFMKDPQFGAEYESYFLGLSAVVTFNAICIKEKKKEWTWIKPSPPEIPHKRGIMFPKALRESTYNARSDLRHFWRKLMIEYSKLEGALDEWHETQMNLLVKRDRQDPALRMNTVWPLADDPDMNTNPRADGAFLSPSGDWNRQWELCKRSIDRLKNTPASGWARNVSSRYGVFKSNNLGRKLIESIESCEEWVDELRQAMRAVRDVFNEMRQADIRLNAAEDNDDPIPDEVRDLITTKDSEISRARDFVSKLVSTSGVKPSGRYKYLLTLRYYIRKCIPADLKWTQQG